MNLRYTTQRDKMLSEVEFMNLTVSVIPPYNREAP